MLWIKKLNISDDGGGVIVIISVTNQVECFSDDGGGVRQQPGCLPAENRSLRYNQHSIVVIFEIKCVFNTLTSVPSFTLKFALLFNNTIWHSRHSCSTASTLSTTESVDLDNFAYLLCNPASQEGEGPCLPPAQPWWSPWLWEMRWTWLWTRSWPGMRRFSIFTIPFISREILDLWFHMHNQSS